VAWAEDYLHTKWHLDPSSRLATIDMGRKLAGLCPLLPRGLGLHHSNTMSFVLRPTFLPSSILLHPAIWPPHIYGPKIGGCAPLGRGNGSPSNAMWPGPRPSCMPSFILIHLTVWPQYTNVTDRQDGTDRTDRQRSDSTGRTVLQTVVQKTF